MLFTNLVLLRPLDWTELELELRLWQKKNWEQKPVEISKKNNGALPAKRRNNRARNRRTGTHPAGTFPPKTIDNNQKLRKLVNKDGYYEIWRPNDE
jgi:hypothetical protein